MLIIEDLVHTEETEQFAVDLWLLLLYLGEQVQHCYLYFTDLTLHRPFPIGQTSVLKSSQLLKPLLENFELVVDVYSLLIERTEIDTVPLLAFLGIAKIHPILEGVLVLDDGV